MITPEETAAIQEEIIRVALDSLKIDLDSFLEVAEMVGSPLALATGTPLGSVTSAGQWITLARLLKPFRDEALQMTDAIHAADIVICDCSAVVNPDCHLGSHEHGHLVAAVWCLTQVDDQDEFMYLCRPCAAAILDGPNASAYTARRLDEEGAEA